MENQNKKVEEIIIGQQNNKTGETDWLNIERKEIENTQIQNRKNALKLEENKLCEFDLIQGAKWDKWTDPETNTVKKIIPVKHNGEEKVFFINVMNPTYKQLVEQASKGKLHYKIIRIGSQKQTRFNIIE